MTEDERTYLFGFIGGGERPARKIIRARIPILADDGRKDRDIAESLHSSMPAVHRARKRSVEGESEGALDERPRPGRCTRKKPDDKGIAILETLARSEPSEGRLHRTTQLLADRLVKLKVVDSTSDEMVRKELKEWGLRLG